MSHSKQKGFAAIEAVLGVVIVGILGFTGWFVWHAKQSTDESLTNTANSQHGITKKKVVTKPVVNKSADETASWLLYEPPGKEYSVRLADGWKLERHQDTSSLYSVINTNLVPQQGTNATVTQVEGGKDARTGFFLNYATQNLDQIYSPGAKQANLTTSDGLAVEKFYYVESNAGDGPGLQNGDFQYTYIIRKSSGVAIVVTYSYIPGSTDLHETVEKVIKTAHFN